MKGPLIAFLMRYFGRLRFPYLAAITAALFVIDLLVPDVIPLVDELLLGFVTVLLTMLKKPRTLPAPEGGPSGR